MKHKYGMSLAEMAYQTVIEEDSKQSREKIKAANMLKYGVENPFQIPDVNAEVKANEYDAKELALNEKLSKLGFEHNNFEQYFLFDGVRKYPDYINEEKKYVLEFNGAFWHRNKMLYDLGIVQPDVVQLRRWYNQYLQHGYQLLVIQETDFEMFMQNDWTINELVTRFLWEPKYDFYMAGPFFKPEHIESMEKLERAVASKGYSMFRPRFDAGQVNMSVATSDDMTITFNNDLEGLANSKIILANMTYLDTGTTFELGFSANLCGSVIFVDSDVVERSVNLMLAKLVNAAFTKIDDLVNWLDTGELTTMSQLINLKKMEVE